MNKASKESKESKESKANNETKQIANNEKGESISSGVDALINKLHLQGVSAGELEAKKIIGQAREQAASIIDEANKSSASMLEEARDEATRIRQGGKDALNIAMRDIVLKLKAKLNEIVSDRIKKLVRRDLSQEDFLKKLILEVAGRARSESDIDAEEEIKILLPQELIGIEDLRQHPLELTEGSLSHFILNVAGDVLREGVVFAEAEDGRAGLRISIEEKDILVDLNDERISDLILEHLQPRFRAILEGMVK